MLREKEKELVINKAKELLGKKELGSRLFFTCNILMNVVGRKNMWLLDKELDRLKVGFAKGKPHYEKNIKFHSWLISGVYDLYETDNLDLPKEVLIEERTAWLQFIIDNL